MSDKPLTNEDCPLPVSAEDAVAKWETPWNGESISLKARSAFWLMPAVVQGYKEMRARVAELTDALEDVLWQATARDHKGTMVFDPGALSAYEDAIPLLVKLGRGRWLDGKEYLAVPVAEEERAAAEAEKGAKP